MQTLRLGSEGPYVEYLQLALVRNGFPVTIDGNFGRQTENALKKFQQSSGLTPDGISGPLTWAAIMPFLRGFSVHTIRNGDTLSQIARRSFTTVNAILNANPGLNPNNLQIGTRIVVPYGFDVVPTNVRYTYFLVKAIVEGLQARYPFITSGSIGNSVMGNNLYSLQIGTGTKEVFYNASHHANEWITTPVLLKFLEDYARAYTNGENIFTFSARELYENITLYMVPLVNPDGVDLVNDAIPKDSTFYTRAVSFSQDYPFIPFPSGWKANIRGVDLNLQYPASWERAREIKFSQGFTSPAPRDFVGTGPLVEPEAIAVYNFTRSRDFLLTLSYHTQGQVIYWRYLDFLPAGSEEIVEVFADVSGYTPEVTPEESGYAGYKDWFILFYDRPGYTIEAGIGQSPLPLSQFNKIYSDNIGILASGMAEAIQL